MVDREKCSCNPPLIRCDNCIRIIREMYPNKSEPQCAKCHSKENTTILKFGNKYHRTCDDCIPYFEAAVSKQ